MNITNIALIYIATTNVLAFLLYGIDKHKATRSKWRISETALMMLAIVGGSVGAWLGMKVWHHKTMHKKFKYGIPFILMIQLGLLVVWLWNRGW